MNLRTIRARSDQPGLEGPGQGIFHTQEQRRRGATRGEGGLPLLIRQGIAETDAGGKLGHEERLADAGIPVQDTDGPQGNVGPPEPARVFFFHLGQGDDDGTGTG